MASQNKLTQNIRRFPWAYLALFGGVLTVYILTLSPGVLGGDVGELQFVPHILGLAHPTGTPLYVMLGKLWTTLPLGPSVAWRMNLLSSVSAALTVVVVFYHVRWSTEYLVPALVSALTFAFGIVFWEQATMADKYAFNALMVALVLHLALRWGKTGSSTALNFLAFTYGLSLTHHRTMALFAPALLGYVWWHERGSLWRDWRRLLRLAALFLAPLLLYLYLPWAEARNLPPGTWHPRTLQDWYHYIMDTGQIGFLYIDPSDLGERLLFYANTLQRDFTWVGVLLGLGGLLVQFRRRAADAVFLLFCFLLIAFLAANHHLHRQWTFFIPSFLIFVIWVGEALGAVWHALAHLRYKYRKANVLLAVVLALFMFALPIIPFRERYEQYREVHYGAGVLDVWRQAVKQGRMGIRLGEAIDLVDQDAIIVSDWEQATPLWYYQQVEGWRPDVEIVYPVERLEEVDSSGRPLYITRNVPGLADHWHPFASGPLVALRTEPVRELPPGSQPLDLQLGEAFELIGYDYGDANFLPATVVPLTVYWRALRTPEHDFSVSLRVLDQEGRVIFKVDSQHPVLGTYPTSRWTLGEVVGDYHEIQLPADLSPGTYLWGVMLYRALPDGGWDNLKVADSGAELAIGGTFEVTCR
jgi:hypothetical protein